MRRCNGVTADSRSLYKSCPACQIPDNFHLAGHGNSRKKVEIPLFGFWRLQLCTRRRPLSRRVVLTALPASIRAGAVEDRRAAVHRGAPGMTHKKWNFHFFLGISMPSKMEVKWNLAGWAGFVERPRVDRYTRPLHRACKLARCTAGARMEFPLFSWNFHAP